MVAANDIGSFPVYRLFIQRIEEYPRDFSTHEYDGPPKAVDILIAFLFSGKKVKNWPNQNKKESYAIPVKISMYSF